MQRTFPRKVEEGREVLPVGHLRALVPEVIEERMAHRLDGAQPCARGVLEQPRHQVDRLDGGAWPEYL